jgi:hypothetical protein
MMLAYYGDLRAVRSWNDERETGGEVARRAWW